MDMQRTRLFVVPGEGLVARHDQALLVARPGSSAQEEVVDRILGVLSGATSGSDRAIREVCAVIASSPVDTVGSIGLVFARSSGVVTVLTGDVTATIEGVDGNAEVARGSGSVTYSERVWADEPASVLVASAGPGSEPDRRTSLHEGVVHGSGVLMVPRLDADAGAEIGVEVERPVATLDSEPSEAEPEAGTDQEPDPQVSFTAISLTGEDDGFDLPDATIRRPIGDLHDAETASDTPGAQDAPGSEDVEREPTMVQGIRCSRGHFNRPGARFCELCGISTVHQTHNLVTGVRPPLGVLVIDDGTLLPLTHDLVIGREAGVADQVAAGTASPVTLDDPELKMSRVHLGVVLDGWEVRLVDLHSANGTRMRLPAEDAWVDLSPGLPTTVPAGTRVELGGRTLSFESHQRS